VQSIYQDKCKIFKTNPVVLTTSWLHQLRKPAGSRSIHHINATTAENIFCFTGLPFFKIVYLLQTLFVKE